MKAVVDTWNPQFGATEDLMGKLRPQCPGGFKRADQCEHLLKVFRLLEADHAPQGATDLPQTVESRFRALHPRFRKVEAEGQLFSQQLVENGLKVGQGDATSKPHQGR